MPYPNSQTPVTLKLNDIFSNPTTDRQRALADLRNTPDMGQLARTYGVVSGPYGIAHVNRWPRSQQQCVKDAMILALTKNTPISFDWQTDTTTSAEVVYFSDRIAVTFHSPLNYPPYWGP